MDEVMSRGQSVREFQTVPGQTAVQADTPGAADGGRLEHGSQEQLARFGVLPNGAERGRA